MGRDPTRTAWRQAHELPVLELDHHREEVAEVDRVDLHDLLVVHRRVDDVDPRVGLAEGHRPLPRGVELLPGGHREAVVVEARGLHGIVLGDEVDELLPVDAREHQPMAVLGHHRQLVEAEHLLEVPAQVGPTGLVELVGGHAHRHVVHLGDAPGIEGVSGHQLSFGSPASAGHDHRLAGDAPGGQALHRLGQAVEGHVVGVDQEVGGQPSRGEQLEGPLEAVGVVDERPAHLELVQQHPVRVEAWAARCRRPPSRAGRPGAAG